MLCSICNTISIELDSENAEVEIRRYSNLFELRFSSKKCDFCSLLCGVAGELEYPLTGDYCKGSWGTEFFNKLLEQSPVVAYHQSYSSEHNVFLRCHLDARNTYGYPGGPTGFDWRNMLGGIYVTPESEVAHIVSGRPFSSNLTKNEQILLCKEKYDDCRLTHDQCNNFTDPAFMPTRILDLEPNTIRSGRIRLLVVPHGFKRAYAALSYCWGNVQNVSLTNANMDQFTKEGIRLSGLPATIKDACELCIGVGIKYLWVCSLCIVQDSDTDWLQESSMMKSVYNCSDFTISVASGRHCNAGLFKDRACQPIPFATIGWRNSRDGDGTRSTCCVRAKPLSGGFTEPLSLRGWALQESLLSRRLLTRGTVEISWQCAAVQWNQSGTLRITSQSTKDIFPCPLLMYPMGCYGSVLAEDSRRKQLTLEIWQDLVSVYCRRRLTFSKDKLPAISGLAKWLSRRCSTEERYIAGLWSSRFPQCLLWHTSLTLPFDESDLCRPTPYRAPSWTWASVDNKYVTWLDVSYQDKTAEVSNYKLSYKSVDIFGEVSGGSLDIEAPMQQGWLVPSRTHPEHFDFWDENWRDELCDRRPTLYNKSLGSAYLDLYEAVDVRAADVWKPKDRARTCDCLRITSHSGLLVAPLEARVDHDGFTEIRLWQRVGIVRFKEERASEWWAGAPKKAIRLV